MSKRPRRRLGACWATQLTVAVAGLDRISECRACKRDECDDASLMLSTLSLDTRKVWRTAKTQRIADANRVVAGGAKQASSDSRDPSIRMRAVAGNNGHADFREQAPGAGRRRSACSRTPSTRPRSRVRELWFVIVGADRVRYRLRTRRSRYRYAVDDR